MLKVEDELEERDAGGLGIGVTAMEELVVYVLEVVGANSAVEVEVAKGPEYVVVR